MKKVPQPKVSIERSGIDGIRKQTFEDYLHLDTVSASSENDVQITEQLRKSLMRRFLKEPEQCPENLLLAIQKIEHLSATEEAAKRYFNSLGLKKLPSMQLLKQEYAVLLAENKKGIQSTSRQGRK